MINPDDINKSQIEIEKLFYLQVENGQQSASINNPNASACGQFLKEYHREQRGIHGTSAALYVLSHSHDQSQKVTIPKLFHYITNRQNIETNITNNQMDASIIRDSKNIIKIGEILNSLSNINTGIVPKDNYVQQLLNELTSFKKNRDGWGYFTDSPERDAELLPTIFAIKGILSIQSADDDAVRFVARECLNKINSNTIDNTSYAIVILGIYTLSFYDLANVAGLNFKEIVSKLFSKNPMSLSEGNEMNIEYWYGEKHEYIRIPWQIYLIALAAKYSPIQFSKLVTQERLKELVGSTLNAGFKYVYSGPYISSRTNYIIYECLSHVKQNLKSKLLYDVLYFIDQIREFLGKSGVRYLIKFLIIVLFGYSLYLWRNSTTEREKLNNIATEVINFALFWLFSLGKRRK